MCPEECFERRVTEGKPKPKLEGGVIWTLLKVNNSNTNDRRHVKRMEI
jgi:hypothetical protein